MARILLIETSTAQLSTALAEDSVVKASRICDEPRMQAALTAPYVKEVLEGLTVRWSEKALYLKDKITFGPATALFTEVTWSDEEGLLAAHGDWSTFSPLTRAESILSEEEAVKAFAGIGMDEPQPEACWFLDLTKKEATATLAKEYPDSLMWSMASRV